jgi:hypothetical protein
MVLVGSFIVVTIPPLQPSYSEVADAELLVGSFDTNEVKRYDGITGVFIDVFITAGDGGLEGPGDILRAPNGNFLVSSFFTNEI